jgi:transcription elongation factor Elf1
VATKKWREDNKEKLQKYRRDWYRKNSVRARARTYARRKEIRKWWRELKSTFACSKCGENNPACIEFHHSKGKKEVTLSRAVHNGWSKEHILREMKKCKAMCANCHRKFHFNIYWGH